MKPFVFPAVVFLLSACSLLSFEPRVPVHLALPAGLDVTAGRPSLAGMSHFAILARGPVSNSLSSADVGRRDLSCMMLEGQAIFPLTLEQISKGVTLSMPPGLYRFSIIGFSDSALSQPNSISQMVSASPQIGEYLIAQGEKNTTEPGVASLALSFQPGVTPNRFSLCPVLDYTVYAALRGISYTTLYKYDGNNWSTSSFDSGYNYDSASLYVDAGGLGHLTHGFAPGKQMYYTNSTNIAQQENVSVDLATYSLDTSLSQTSAGTLATLINYNFGGNGTGTLYQRSGTSWSIVQDLFPSWVNGYSGFTLHFGPNLSGAAAAVRASTPPIIALTSLGLGGGTWPPPSDVSGINAQPCSEGTKAPRVQVDNEGYTHLVYQCDDAVDHLGYRTNRSGSWVTTEITSSVPTLNNINLSIDPTGQMHLVYHADSSIFYSTAPSSTGTWSTPTPIYAAPDALYDMEMTAVDPGNVQIVFMEFVAPSQQNFCYLTNRSGSWVKTNIIFFPLDPPSIARGMFAR